ncbi:MAG: tail fiber domain-containing protein [Methyloglobulus sp.]|nr:hypothetical protein [Methyloglobulus sp.]
MKLKSNIVISTTIVIAAWVALASAASPPNPTASDFSNNTAGGANVLLKNEGFDNTGFGSSALSGNTTGMANTATGSGALAANTGGITNTANGAGALLQNTTGSANTAIGSNSLASNTKGYYNTAIGEDTLLTNTTGNFNTVSGAKALSANISGSGNATYGAYSLLSNITGRYNAAVGYGSLQSNTKGSVNTALGNQSLMNNISGSYNIALGNIAGINLVSGNRNIYIGNEGLGAESSTIRIGNSSQTRTFIAGIRNNQKTIGSAVSVVIDSNGQLGILHSSAEYKTDIQSMNDTSSKLMQLRPVTYHYKDTDKSDKNSLEYGLIAEEVAKVYPDLVAYGADGKIETVQYHKLTPMLLNEVQRMNRSLDADNLKISKQDKQLTTAHQLIQQQAQEIVGLKQQADKVASLEQQVTALKTQGQAIAALTSRLSRMEANQSVGLLEAGTRLSN